MWGLWVSKWILAPRWHDPPQARDLLTGQVFGSRRIILFCSLKQRKTTRGSAEFSWNVVKIGICRLQVDPKSCRWWRSSDERSSLRGTTCTHRGNTKETQWEFEQGCRRATTNRLISRPCTPSVRGGTGGLLVLTARKTRWEFSMHAAPTGVPRRPTKILFGTTLQEHFLINAK